MDLLSLYRSLKKERRCPVKFKVHFLVFLFALLTSSLLSGTSLASKCTDATEAQIREFTLDTFSRNIGIMSEAEIVRMSKVRVAVAGVGAIGSEAIRGLVGLGVRKFNQADPDRIEKVNRNKQSIAHIGNEGHLKVDATEQFVIKRNPFAEINSFPEGIHRKNIDAFLKDVDMVVDGMDVFAMSTRRLVFQRAHELGIPVVSVAPLGRSTSVMIFRPDGVTYDAYFDVNGKTSQNEHLLHFLIGMAPKALHRNHYKEELLRMNEGIAPSYIGSTQAAAGQIVDVVRTELLGTNELRGAPYSYQFDFSKMRVRRTRLHYGLKSPLQRAKLAIARRQLSKHFLPEENGQE